MARLFVVDQNYLRGPELSALASEPAVKFVVLDEALIEMCKAPQWEETMRGSLHTFASSPGRIHVARSMAEGLRWELHHKQSIAGQLLHREGTEFLRDILKGIQRGETSKNLEVMRAGIEDTQREMAEIHFDHESNKQNMVELVKTTTSTQPDLAEALRKKKLSRDERLSIIRAQGIQIAESFFHKGGLNGRESRRMMRERGLAVRFGLVRLWYAFDWLTRLGIEGIAAEKVSNEKIDYRYTTIATFFNGGLLTREVQMKECFGDISELLRRWNTL